MAAAADSGSFWRPADGGVTVRIRVQPRARRAGLGGVAEAADGPRLRLAVATPPEDGRANAAACAALAAALGVRAGAVSVLQGAGAREKLLLAVGDPNSLAARLPELEKNA